MTINVELTAALEAAGVAWRELGQDEPGCQIDGVAPRVLAEPASVAELAAALGAAGAAGAAVIPRGGGTKLDLGNPPRAADLLLSTRRLDRVVEYEPANLTVSVEAGLSLARLQAILAERGQFLPLDPPDADRATIGGTVATNASGPLRLGYGSARDLLIGARVANVEGKVVKSGGKVVKNVAGYDLNKLYVGSLGTLGVLAELTFKVAPRPTATGTLLARFGDSGAADGAAREIIRSALQPLALELLYRAAAAEVGLAGPGDATTCVLAVLVAGVAPAVHRQVRDLAGIARSAGGKATDDLDAAASSRLWEAIAELPRFPAGSPGVRCKASVPVAALAPAIEALAAVGKSLGSPPVVFAHAGSGVVYARWPAEVAAGAQTSRAAAALAEARRVIVALSGSLVVEAAPLALKQQLDVWGNSGDALSVMRAIKTQLDPRGFLNPGRFVGGI